ncbi:MAG: glycoside hydrolase family 127 protein [Verrucomicrobiae bacterium]|nr:glycoside hydrolase family 127 protein [Verrucomicrobiae bacterium]
MKNFLFAAFVLLGAASSMALEFVVIWERPAAQSAKPLTDPSRVIQRIAMANDGGNRFVWRLDFLAPYRAENSSIILYLDADNSPSTGRSGHGCEFMLHCREGIPGASAFTPDGKTCPAPLPRVTIANGSLFVSYDVDLAQRDSASQFRLSALSETIQPRHVVHSTGYFEAKGPPVSARPKTLLDSDLTASVGVEQTWGLDRINALVEDPHNVSIWIRDCKLTGFRFDKSEYRADNALRAAATGTITATVPPGASGRFHVGFIFYDTAGVERIGIYVNGQRRGVAVADFDDNNQHLFFLTEPLELKPGDTIELRALTPTGIYRTEDIVLLREKPPARPPLYEFREIAVTGHRLTWISTWPAECTVELNDGRKIVEPLAVQNHRVTLPVNAGRFRITATARDGRTIGTGWRKFAVKPFAEPPTKQNGRVTLRVESPVSVRDWPVTSGVPFPKGALGSARNVRLLNAAGAPVPLQVSATGRWPDGSVKWLLVDFRHSGGTADYTLEFGPKISRQEPKHDAAIPDCGELILTDAAGKEHRTGLAGFSPEDGGGLRRCYRANGRIGGSVFAYEARVHVYPGLPWVRVLLTTGHGESTNEFSTVRSLAWRLPSLKGAPQRVQQRTDLGERRSGQIGPVFLRDFWQNYPKDIEVGPEGTTVWLMPRLRPDEYDVTNRQNHDWHKLYFWFDNGGYKLRQGMTKTHEVWLGLDGSTPPLDRPLMAVAPPRWYANSGAFGELTVADPNRPVVRDYDQKVQETLDAYLRNREKNREYGMFNFGDWWGERLINWGNIEYDTQHAFFLQFVRSGDLRFFRAGDEAETHNRDVDTVHYHVKPARIGCVYAHCIGHVGDYLAKSPLPGKDQGIAGGHFSVSHTWCEGHLDHYFLTGDRRSYETAIKIADHYNTYRFTSGYDFTNCRDSGWHLILTMAVYRATGDPFYLNAAKIIVERVLERQTPKPKFNTKGGGWRRMMVPGHCYCEPAHYGNAGFMVGVLLTGLKWYHLETGDPRVARSIIMGANFLVDDMWEEDIGGFRYTSCPVSSKGAWSNFLLFDGIGYAYRLTQRAGKPDAKLAHVLRKGTAPAIQSMSGMGKSFSQFIRVAPHFIGLLAELREEK